MIRAGQSRSQSASFQRLQPRATVCTVKYCWQQEGFVCFNREITRTCVCMLHIDDRNDQELSGSLQWQSAILAGVYCANRFLTHCRMSTFASQKASAMMSMCDSTGVMTMRSTGVPSSFCFTTCACLCLVITVPFLNCSGRL